MELKKALGKVLKAAAPEIEGGEAYEVVFNFYLDLDDEKCPACEALVKHIHRYSLGKHDK